MPMQGDPLKPAELAALKTWIDQGAAWETSVSFAKDIHPIFSNTCGTCHGDTAQLSKFDLRTRASALLGGERGSDIVPVTPNRAGCTAASPVSRNRRCRCRLAADARASVGDQAMDQRRREMGYAGTNAVFFIFRSAGAPSAAASAAVAALMERPITQAERDYWTFKLPVQTPPPVVANKNFVNPIDRFLEKTRVEHGVKAAPRADKNTLVRRAYLDLLGLPPTPAQVQEFVSDQSPDAWENLIDKLLASPHYGERYGRHWLDVARYADSGGFEYDIHRPNAWRYRDYVIKSFNQDKAFTQFITEQLAAMRWITARRTALVATGFLRMGPRVLFREKDNPERRFDYLDEMIGTIGKGMLGLTVNCARCHNHKFDPIMAKDYYAMEAALFGYVENRISAGAAGRGRGVPREERRDYRQGRGDVVWKSRSSRSLPRQAELEEVKKKYPGTYLPCLREAGKRADTRRAAPRHSGADGRQSVGCRGREADVACRARPQEGAPGGAVGAPEAAAQASAEWRRSSPTAITGSSLWG
jgi:hypothetical protein